MRVEYSQKAVKDLILIHDYLIENFGANVADKKIFEIKNDIDYLARDPFMGRSVDGHDQNLRQFRSGPSVILYDVDDNVVEILHIVDGRTNYQNDLLNK